MDDLKHQVGEIGRRMDQGFVSQRQEMSARFDRLEAQFSARFEKIDERFEKIDKRFDRVDERFDKVDERFNRTQEMVIGLHATITRLSLGLAAAAVGLLVTQL
jgi:hypothetical protein